METAEIKAYHEIYRKELFDYVVTSGSVIRWTANTAAT